MSGSLLRHVDCELPLIGRFAKQQVLLEGSSPALRKLSELLTSGESFVLSLIVPEQTIRPGPYQGFLKMMQVDIQDGAVIIAHTKDGVLLVAGPRKPLTLMGLGIENVSKSDPLSGRMRRHIHFDLASVENMADQSEELVVSLEAAAGPNS